MGLCDGFYKNLNDAEYGFSEKLKCYVITILTDI